MLAVDRLRTQNPCRDGIGEARTKAIIKGRRYKGKDDLVAKNILPQAVYDKIADQIVPLRHRRC